MARTLALLAALLPTAAAVAGHSWQLFPEGQVPGFANSSYGPEAHVTPDHGDPVGAKCSPGDDYGIWYYNVSVPTLVPYLVKPGKSGRSNASVIVMPGGGLQFLAWTKEGSDIAEWLNSLGISAFVLKYRVPERKVGGQEVAVQDAQRALSLVRSRAEELGLDATRVGVIGFSAGGFVASSVATAENRTYEAVDEVDSFGHLPDFMMLLYGASSNIGTPRNPSMPTFVVHAANDPCISPSGVLDYVYKVMSKGGRPEFHMYPDGRHGFGVCKGYPKVHYEVCTWTDRAAAFLREQVQGLPSSADLQTEPVFA